MSDAPVEPTSALSVPVAVSRFEAAVNAALRAYWGDEHAAPPTAVTLMRRAVRAVFNVRFGADDWLAFAGVDEPKDVWFVWSRNATRPRYAHDTEAEAAEQAKALAAKNPGSRFLVLHATRKFYVEPESDPEAALSKARGE